MPPPRLGFSRGLLLLACLAVTLLAAVASVHDGVIYFRPDGRPDDGPRLELRWSVDEVYARSGGGIVGEYQGGDVASYIECSKELRATGRFHKTYASSWPPGMPLLILAVTAVFGPEDYILNMWAVAVGLWSLALFAVVTLFRPTGRPLFDLALAASPFLLPSFRSHIFGFGTVMTESVSHALFVIGLAFLADGIARSERRRFVQAGVSLGLATLFRTYFEFVAQPLFLGVAAVFAVGAWLPLQRWAALRPRLKAHAWAWGLAFLAFNATLLPWRAYKVAHWHRPEMYSAPRNFRYGLLWATDEKLPYFAVAANAACHADPENCAALAARTEPPSGAELERLATRALIQHPLRWYGYKLAHFDRLWFGDTWSETVKRRPHLVVEAVVLAVIVLVGLSMMLRALVRRPSTSRAAVVLVFGSFVACNALTFSMLHLEWRYSLPLKLFAAMVPWWFFRFFRGSESR